jgi:hypothetical protein
MRKERAEVVMPKEDEKGIVLYKTPLFERCLDDLRRKGGTASDAAGRIDVFVLNLVQSDNGADREKFRYTRNGEYRIRHCKKISLGCGYRLVFIQKDSCFIFLYAGSHDDCFRWIERNKGLSYEVDHSTHAISVVQDAGEDAAALPEDVREAREFVDRYEQELMRQLDDDLLARIFSGWCRTDPNKDCRRSDQQSSTGENGW